MTYINDPPRRRNVCCSSDDEHAKLERLAAHDELLPLLAQLLHDQQTRQTLHRNKQRARQRQKGPPPVRGGQEPPIRLRREDVEADEEEEGVHGHLQHGERMRAPEHDHGAMDEGVERQEEREEEEGLVGYRCERQREEY